MKAVGRSSLRSSTRLFMDPYRSTEGASTYLIVADAGAVREGICLHESLEDVGEGEVADEDVVGGEGNVVVVLDGDVQGDHVSVSENDTLLHQTRASDVPSGRRRCRW